MEFVQCSVVVVLTRGLVRGVGEVAASACACILTRQD